MADGRWARDGPTMPPRAGIYKRYASTLGNSRQADRVRNMPRARFAALAALLCLSSALASGVSGAGTGPSSATRVTTGAAAPIVLRGRQGSYGPWRRYLWLKLVKVELTSFSVCAVWNRASPPPPTCHAARGDRLPRGTIMRLEQRLARSPLRRGSPGWRTVGTSRDAALTAVLSNAVSGNRPGAVSYRVTLRNASGRVYRTSNTFRVFWQL
jgi:hypothetical protein